MSTYTVHILYRMQYITAGAGVVVAAIVKAKALVVAYVDYVHTHMDVLPYILNVPSLTRNLI